MNNTLNKSILFLTLLLGFVVHGKAQVQYNNCSNTGTYSSAIGNSTVASGNNSFAGGYSAKASGSNSFAFGYNSKATQSTTTAVGNTATASGAGSIAIGNYVKATAKNSFVFGAGTTSSYPLTNSTAHSIAFGVNSNKPTMLITKSLNNNYTGKVAIGDVSPTAKLHIKSDNNEDANVFIEPANKNDMKAYISLFDTEHSISVDNSATMELNSNNGPIRFKANSYCFGKDGEPQTRIHTKDKHALYYNAKYENGIELRESQGPSYAIDFNNSELLFRTAAYQYPRSNEITNWQKALSISVDGKISFGSKDIYLKNDADSHLLINSPKTLDLQSSNITLTGKIGINATNKVDGYALAVNGGIISNKVFIKEVNQWPDYVFSEEYALMDLEDLKNYLDEHKHLPGVPSHDDVINNGYDVNNMQQIMLEKIEEMTRYILILQDEINVLKSERTAMRDSITFSYDADGNRISRSISFKRIVSSAPDLTTAQHTSYDLFPNPTSGQFSLIIKDPSMKGKLHASLHTITGTTIAKGTIEGDRMSFDLSTYPSGIYLLEVDAPEGRQSWKVIKQ